MRLPSIELAPFTSAHDLLGIGDCRRPVEPLAERVPDQGSWHGVMSSHSAVDINQQLLSLLDGDASLQDSHVASFVELLSDEDVRFGPSSQPTRLCFVIGEDVVEEVIQVRPPPIFRGVGPWALLFFQSKTSESVMETPISQAPSPFWGGQGRLGSGFGSPIRPIVSWDRRQLGPQVGL